MLNLYPHQVEACAWLQARKYGILADQMRLGKSLSTAAACLDRLPALIVCPASVKFHWRKEFLRLDPNLKIETAPPIVAMRLLIAGLLSLGLGGVLSLGTC